MAALLGLLVVGYVSLAAFATGPLWRSILRVAWSTLTSRHLTIAARARLLSYIALDLLLAPVRGALNLVDDALFSGYRRTRVAAPVFIVGQPRSGTTFLHRTLAEGGGFLSLTHLEWRYPFICLWKLLDATGLRKLVEAVDYWPNDAVGRAARKMHEHRLGSYEEHGVFLEERFYQHYFVFRRFPLPELLAPVSGFAELPPAAKARLLRGIRRAVRKAMYYRRSDRIWLTKENESVEFYALMAEVFPDARYVFIARDPGAFIDSYINLSVTSTQAKTGLDPRRIPGWHEANIAFRRAECRRMIAFSERVAQTNPCVSIAFEDLVQDVDVVVPYVFERLGFAVTDDYAAHLAELRRRQKRRERGYENAAHNVAGFEFFADYVRRIRREYATAVRAAAGGRRSDGPSPGPGRRVDGRDG
ncbi:MAG: sulfotransferase [Nannocystaceae bacterium]